MLNEGLYQTKIKPTRTIDISMKSQIYWSEFDMRQTKFLINFYRYHVQLTLNFINNPVCIVTYHEHYGIKTCASVHYKLHAFCEHDDVIKWKHFSASLAICAGNSPVTGEFPAQRPMTWSFDDFFDLRNCNECQWIMPQYKFIPCGNNFDHYFEE